MGLIHKHNDSNTAGFPLLIDVWESSREGRSGWVPYYVLLPGRCDFGWKIDTPSLFVFDHATWPSLHVCVSLMHTLAGLSLDDASLRCLVPLPAWERAAAEVRLPFPCCIRLLSALFIIVLSGERSDKPLSLYPLRFPQGSPKPPACPRSCSLLSALLLAPNHRQESGGIVSCKCAPRSDFCWFRLADQE